MLRDFVIWASFCICNLLTQFQRSGIRSRVSPVFSPLCSSWVHLWFFLYFFSPAAARLLGPLWANNTSSCRPYFSSSLSSRFSYSSHLSVSVHQALPLSLICSGSVVFKSSLIMLPLRMCFKGDVKAQPQAEKGRQKGCVCGGVVGLIVRLEGNAVICALSAAWGLTHRDVFHPVTFLYKEQGRVLMWSLKPAAWEWEQFQQYTWTPLCLILWWGFHVLYCLTHRIRHLGCACGQLLERWFLLVFVCPRHFFLREWAVGKCLCVCLLYPLWY